MKPTRRSFLAFLGSLVPGLALARAGIGGGAPVALAGLDAWLPVTTEWIPLFGTERIWSYEVRYRYTDEHGNERTGRAPLEWTGPGYSGIVRP